MKRLHYLSLSLLCTLSCVIATHADELKAGVFTPARAAPDFALQGTDGRKLSLADYRGKVIALSFGYSSCQAVCPITLAVLAQAHHQLGEQSSQVQVIYITVDPERDNASKLKQFLAAFDPSFIGGTGTPTQLAAVRKLYGVTAERHGSGDDYVISHSSFIYLIDRKGDIRALMPFGHKPADFVHDLKLLLKE